MIEHDVLTIGIKFLHKKVLFFCNIIIECVGFNSHLTSKCIPIGFYNGFIYIKYLYRICTIYQQKSTLVIVGQAY